MGFRRRGFWPSSPSRTELYRRVGPTIAPGWMSEPPWSDGFQSFILHLNQKTLTTSAKAWSGWNLAIPAGLEPATACLEGRRTGPPLFVPSVLALGLPWIVRSCHVYRRCAQGAANLAGLRDVCRCPSSRPFAIRRRSGIADESPRTWSGPWRLAVGRARWLRGYGAGARVRP